jgi:hypothetical protein
MRLVVTGSSADLAPGEYTLGVLRLQLWLLAQ